MAAVVEIRIVSHSPMIIAQVSQGLTHRGTAHLDRSPPLTTQTLVEVLPYLVSFDPDEFIVMVDVDLTMRVRRWGVTHEVA